MLSNVSTHITIQRRQYVLNRFSISRSSLYRRIADGLLPPPISLGERAVGWLEHELDRVIEAMVAGQSKQHIKTLVKHLVDQRQHCNSHRFISQ